MASETEDFAALLRELKGRSGRSYGVLAGKLHVSTSTLHRYCNGDAVPTDYAPVERLARLCGATPDELVEVHRRWIVADAARRRKPSAAAPAPQQRPEPVRGDVPVRDGASVRDDASVREEEPVREEAAVPEAAPVREDSPVRAESPVPPDETAPVPLVPGAPAASQGPEPSDAPGAPRAVRRWTRKRVALVGAGVVALAVPAAVAVAQVTGTGDEGRKAPAGYVKTALPSADPSGSRAAESGKPAGSPGPDGETGATKGGSPSPTAPGGGRTPGGGTGPGKDKGTGTGAGSGSASDDEDATGVPLTVSSRINSWEDRCTQYYLLGDTPAQVPEPPTEQDTGAWARSLGAVTGGTSKTELVVQGKSEKTVVLQALHVRVVGRSAPLDWAAYSMGSGCGGGMTPRSFDIDLDAGQPAAQPAAGEQGDVKIPATDFPYKVSLNDPQVLNITAHTAGHTVSWYLELEWSSGGRHGTTRIDDHGKPFRTSGMKGAPKYAYNDEKKVWERDTGS
ncbi:helix-turn-helix domain-containing protein [Streptomyces varsoviensis]|uniref:helix-turn-helix domain-containing protein n=1 Tax=Streptomyces varsoviensis TaxID=67373 RepID=UPI003410FBDE